MKKYMNAQEVNDFLIMSMAGESAKDILDGWGDNMSKEERKALKTAYTWFKKFQTSVIQRMDKPTQDKLLKRSSKFQIKILDEYSTQQIMGTFENALKIIHMTRDQLDDLAEQSIEFNCRGCKKDYKSCQLHDVFYDNFILESSHGLENCRYAYPDGEIRLKKE